MTKLYCFSVSPRTELDSVHFPLDMLRYDQCWPQFSQDVLDLCDSTWKGVHHFDDPKPVRKVLMCSHKEPTNERWLSFSWQVSNVTKR